MDNMMPFMVSSPGEIIMDELESRGWTQRDLAEIMGRPYQAINEIIRGTKQITPETAGELAQAFGTSIEFWMNLETNYRLFLVRQKAKSSGDDMIARRSRLYSIAPVKEMIKRSWIPGSKDVGELEKQVCSFLKITSPGETPNLLEFAGNASFRVGRGSESTPEERYVYAWLRRVEQLCNQQAVCEYKSEKLPDLVTRLLALSFRVENIALVPETLLNTGIHFVIVPALPKTYLDGSAWTHDGNPIIALTLRYNRIDYFWFTLLHELAHIFLGGDRKVYCDDITKIRKSDDEVEKKANRIAGEWLIDDRKLDNFIKTVKPIFSQKNIEDFSQHLGRHPGIVLGQLQYREVVGYQAMRSLLVEVTPYLENWVMN